MYSKNKTVGREEHNVLVSLGLGEKGWGGNQLSVGHEFMAHRQGMFPRFLDAEESGEGAERNAGGKGLTCSEGRTGRVETLCTPVKEEHGLPLSNGSECPSQETIISSTTFQENAINMLLNILVL